MGIPRILGLMPTANDGCSFYRSVAPYNELHKQGAIHFDYTLAGQPLDWDTFSRFDTIFFQRPYTKQHVDNCIAALMSGKKIIVDYDDYLFALSKDNPVYKVYMNQQATNNQLFFLNNAHAITCSTEFLADRLREKTDRPERFHVIPNALNDYMLKVNGFARGDGIFYRGSNTHVQDLTTVKAQMIRIGKEHKMSFFGYDPEFITKKIDYFHYAWSGILGYFDNIRNGLWKIMIVPLADHDFNRSKSNCSFLEATFAGAATLAPDFDEFLKPGITNYKNPKDFGIKLKMMINDKDYCEAQWNLAKNHIDENLLLSDVNKKRLEVLQKLN